MRPADRVNKIRELCVEAMQAESRRRRKRLNEVTRDLKFLVAEQIDWEIKQERKAS